MRLSAVRVSIFAVGLLAGIAVGYLGMPHLVQAMSAGHQPYAGQDQRRISSLSPADIKALEAGEGWGLAKPAELNGYPGPLHVLELADELDLTDDQRKAVEDSFQRMKSAAIVLGKKLVDAERSLDEAFKSGDMNVSTLETLLALSSQARAKLRDVHLTAHLETTPVLNEAQAKRYQTLRGYGDGHTGHAGH